MNNVVAIDAIPYWLIRLDFLAANHALQCIGFNLLN